MFIDGIHLMIKNPRVDTFEVDMDNCGPKVLDILIKIKNEIDPSINF